MKTVLFIAGESGILEEQTYVEDRLVLSEKDKGVADWVFRNNRTAGMFTKTLPKAGAYFIPLRPPLHTVGVIALGSGSESESVVALAPETENFIQNIVSQIAIRIEHELLSLMRRKSLLVAESERLHKILLNTISHELRTPLTAITGASSGLLDEKISVNPEIRSELAYEIKKASDRLNHLVDNLLDMSRLESGMLKLNKGLYDVHDLVSVALRRLNENLQTHSVQISVSDDIPLLFIDFALMEQVVTNLIYNALLYTPAGSRIEIIAVCQNSFLNIAVKDNGPGLLSEDIPYLFDKFRRGSRTPTGGTGLGLSICRGIVEAHNGTITAMNRKSGGAVFVVELPVSNPASGVK
jgi:two-component system, OmpR family, sensor histidine kinase KdpD